jgi:hypothetical protein
MKKPILALAAALAAAPGFTPAIPAPQDALAWGLPSMSAATYRVADTMRIEIQAPPGPMSMTALAHATLAADFAEDAGGFRASAAVTDFTGTVTNPTMGSQSMGSEVVRGAVVVVVGPTGVTELAGKPELAPQAGQFSLFEDLGYHMFPGLPGGEAAVGDTWTDTYTWSASNQGSQTTSTVTRTYTLEAETVVDGRTLQAIAVAATVEISGSGSQGGMAVTQEIAGSITGHYYWDAEAGLLHSAVLQRDFTGESTMGEMPPVSLTLNGPQHIRREN